MSYIIGSEEYKGYTIEVSYDEGAPEPKVPFTFFTFNDGLEKHGDFNIHEAALDNWSKVASDKQYFDEEEPHSLATQLRFELASEVTRGFRLDKGQYRRLKSDVIDAAYEWVDNWNVTGWNEADEYFQKLGELVAKLGFNTDTGTEYGCSQGDVFKWFAIGHCDLFKDLDAKKADELINSYMKEYGAWRHGYVYVANVTTEGGVEEETMTGFYGVGGTDDALAEAKVYIDNLVKEAA